MAKPVLTDREISALYDKENIPLTQEKNDFILPQIIDYVSGKKWINLRPEYQRRLVWKDAKQSLFIESLLMNIPIPPVFLFEWDYGRYEVMDGQQRLNSIVRFFNNELKLSGLEKWSVLNGRTYSTCPSKIQRGLQRRRISAVVLLAESARDESKADEVRRVVFERLNTGGQNLNAQEMRNAIYAGLFNELLIELAQEPLFNDIWEVPRYQDHIVDGKPSEELLKLTWYNRMEDCETVLRYFAFSGERKQIVGSVKSMLDNCMIRYRHMTEEMKNSYKIEFLRCLNVSHQIFGNETFVLTTEKGSRVKSKPLYDAVMSAIHRLKDFEEDLLEAAPQIRQKLSECLENENFYELVVARPNTATAVRERLVQVERVFKEAI